MRLSDHKFFALACFFLAALACHAQKVIFEPGNISVPDKTTHEISFTRDGQTLYFTRTADNNWGKPQQGFKSVLFEDTWTEPIRVDFIESLYNLSVSPDGNRILFCKGDRTWITTYENGQWSEPVDLNVVADYSFNGGYYHVMDDYSFYYSGVGDDDSHPYDDIYYVPFNSGRYQKPKRLNTNINTDATEFSPWVSRNRDVLIFSRYDASSEENTGIFISRMEQNEWRKAEKIDALDYGWGVFVREDIRTLFYTAGGLICAYELSELGINID